MVRMAVTQMGGSAEDAKDIFQDSLMIILEKIDNREFTLTCRFKTFFYSICENLWKSELIKRKAASNYLNRRLLPDIEEDIADTIEKNTYREILSDAFNSLEKLSKTILKLYFQEVPPQEIAEKLGYSYGYIRRKKSEAQAELIRKIKRHPRYKGIISSEIVTRGVVY